MILDLRTKIQIVAALTFWVSAARGSKTHPAEHPKIEGFFLGQQLPLSEDEIENGLIPMLLDKSTMGEALTTTEFAKGKRIKVSSLRASIKRLKIKPLHVGSGVYSSADLYQAMYAVNGA